jgi:hypothetical protein
MTVYKIYIVYMYASIYTRIIIGQIILRDIAVGIATGYGLNCPGVGIRVPVRVRIFLSKSIPVLSPTKPPIQRIPAALSHVLKRPGYKAEHSPPTSPEDKNTRVYTFIFPYFFHGVLLI